MVVLGSSRPLAFESYRKGCASNQVFASALLRMIAAVSLPALQFTLNVTDEAGESSLHPLGMRSSPHFKGQPWVRIPVATSRDGAIIFFALHFFRRQQSLSS
jgi:hypothetical protein